MKHIELKVHEILMENEDARDDDNLLFSEYLKGIQEEDFTELAELIFAHRIATKQKTVERVRRKLQERNPALRGSKWFERHRAQEDFIQYAQE